MQFKVFTAVENVEARGRLEALNEFLHRKVVVIVEQEDNSAPMGFRAHEFFRQLVTIDPDELARLRQQASNANWRENPEPGY
jgi:hypothetical protein